MSRNRDLVRGENRRRQRRTSLPAYALVAAGIGLIVLLLYLLWLDQLVPLGQQETVYFVVLLFFAGAAAVFVLGIAGASAEYVGEVWGGRIKLGGPPVLFFGVLLLGLGIQEASTFSEVVRLVPEGDGREVVEGEVVLHLPTGPVDAAIGEHATAIFTGLPRELVGTTVELEVHAQGFSPSRPPEVTLGQGPITLRLARDSSPLLIRGQVLAGSDPRPIAGATVLGGGKRALTDGLGRFELRLPSADEARTVELQVLHDGYRPRHVQAIALPRHRGEPDEIQLLLEPE